MLNILLKILIYVVIAPVLAFTGIIWSTIVLLSVLAASPAIAIVSLFFREPYDVMADVYVFAVEMAGLPFDLLVRLVDKK